VSVVILDFFGAGGGVGRCTHEILRQLEMEGTPTVLCGQSHVVDSFKDLQQAMPHVRLVNLERPRFSLRAIRIKFAAKCKRGSSQLADVLLHEATNENHAGGHILQGPILVNYPQIIAPPTSQEAFCVFLHDLNWRFYPGNFQDPDSTDRNCRGWVANASKVITNSECTRDEVIEHYGCASEKVVAAPLAPFGEIIPQDFDSSKYLESLGLSAGRFCLFPGVWGLHKGHDTLTEAIEISRGADPIVVTCGKPLNGIVRGTGPVATMRSSLAATWEKLIAEKKLVVVGGVSECEMQALRIGCRSYVVPSHYEGFGFPLVEAIYYHRPAIVSAIKAHLEILNRYPQYKLARVVPSNSSKALAVELDRVPTEPGPMPPDWQTNIESTWSWKNATQTIHSVLSSEVRLKQ